MLVDRFSAPAERARFDARRNEVLNTLSVLGLSEVNAELVGGAGFAMHGLDTSSTPGLSAFDVDALVDEPTFQRLSGHDSAMTPTGTYGNPWLVMVNESPAPLDFTGFLHVKDGKLLKSIGYPSFETARPAATVIDGIATLPLENLVKGKVKAHRIKDVSGLLHAHVVAYHEQQPVINEPCWTKGIRKAIEIIRQGRALNNLGLPMPYGTPPWLVELRDNDFKHPAFSGIPTQT